MGYHHRYPPPISLGKHATPDTVPQTASGVVEFWEMNRGRSKACDLYLARIRAMNRIHVKAQPRSP